MSTLTKAPTTTDQHESTDEHHDVQPEQTTGPRNTNASAAHHAEETRAQREHGAEPNAVAQKGAGAAAKSGEHAHDEEHDAHDEGHEQSHEEGHGEEHEPTGAGASKAHTIDLSDTISIGLLASALRSIANEPGEVGELKFEIKAQGKFGTGAVNAVVEGWAELVIGYGLDNTNLSTIFVEASGALAAGVDLAGFAQVMVEAGYGRDFLNMGFAGSEAAATWIYTQLVRLNEMAQGVFKLSDSKAVPEGDPHATAGHGDQHGGGDGHGEEGEGAGGHGGGHHAADPNAPVFSMHDRDIFGGVKARADLGIASADASYRYMNRHREYHDQEHNAFPSTEEHHQSEVGFEVESGGKGIGVRYLRDYNITTGSPIFYTNGVFCENEVHLSLLLKDLLSKGGKHVHKKPTAAVQDLIMNTFAGLETLAGPFKYGKALNYDLFSKIVDEMYGHAHIGGEIHADFEFNVIFEWDEYGETTGDLNMMFFRVKVEPVATIGVGAKSLAGGVEGEFSASKSEVVFEQIGSETVSYIQRQFIYESPDRPWEAFKEKNREQIEALAQNMATPGHIYFEKSIHDAFHNGEGNDHEAAIAAMEAHWTKQEHLLGDIRGVAAEIGEELGGGTSFWTWRSSTMKTHMTKIMALFEPYKDDPPALAFLIEMLPAYNVDIEQLKEFAKETGFRYRFGQLLTIAQNAAKPQAIPAGGH